MAIGRLRREQRGAIMVLAFALMGAANGFERRLMVQRADNAEFEFAVADDNATLPRTKNPAE
jgi:hypothetical protein